MTKESKQTEYSAKNINVLKGLEAVRKRPAMYIGDVGTRGLHHLVNEVVDNSIDEALVGFADMINITIHKDETISVEVNALSEWLKVEVKRDGKVYFQEYKRGIALKPVKEIGTAKKNETGTKVTFK